MFDGMITTIKWIGRWTLSAKALEKTTFACLYDARGEELANSGMSRKGEPIVGIFGSNTIALARGEQQSFSTLGVRTGRRHSLSTTQSKVANALTVMGVPPAWSAGKHSLAGHLVAAAPGDRRCRSIMQCI